MCHVVIYFRLILFGNFRALFMFMSLPKFGKLSAVIFSNKLSCSFLSPFSFYVSHVCVLVPLMVCPRSSRLFLFFFSLFLFLLIDNPQWPFLKFTNSFLFLIEVNVDTFAFLNFIYCIFQLQKLFDPFDYFYLFVKLLVLFVYYFPYFVELFVFFVACWVNLKPLFWIFYQLIGRSPFLWGWLLETFSVCFVVLYFLIFSMFLEVLHYCLWIWEAVTFYHQERKVFTSQPS